MLLYSRIHYQDSLRKRNIRNFSFVNFPLFSPMMGKNLLKQIQHNKRKTVKRNILKTHKMYAGNF